MSRRSSPDIDRWLDQYKNANQPLLDADPGFRQWLEEEYVPIAGGWQY